MRGRLFNRIAIARIAGFTLVAAALIAAGLRIEGAGKGHGAAPKLASAPVDPLAIELARCQAIGGAAENDAGCAAAWAENRRRFFEDRHPQAVVAPTSAPLAKDS